ncbi:MAG: hypothetical protein HZA28_08100 [Candidatus Omnitrophica bacterium]|nr:hypothetical protein [Candidatus Omnitrophota bacterium]
MNGWTEMEIKCNVVVFVLILGVFGLLPTVTHAQPPLVNATVAAPVEETPAADKPVVPPAAPQPQAPIKTVLGTLEVSDMDIRDVFTRISLQTGLVIVADEDVQARVTIYLRDVDVFDALRVILELNHLAYTMEGAAARVMTEKTFEERFGYPFSQKVQTRMVPVAHARPGTVEELLNTMKGEAGKVIYSEGARSFILIDTPPQLDAMEDLVRKMDVPVETRAFDLRYRKAKEIAPQVQGVLTENVGRVEFGEGENKMTVTDTSLGLDAAARKVAELDQPKEEVFFEVKILQIILGDEYREGVDWGAIVSDYQSVAFPGFGAKEGKGALSLGTVNEEDYVVLLDALDTVGVINTVSNLKLTASPGTASEIFIRSSDLLADFDPGEKLPAATGKRDVLYRVTPDIGKGKEIVLDVRPEVFGGASGTAAGADKGVELKVDNGATVVIGGLFKEATVEATRKIPLLGDLPFLGFAFRLRGERFRDTEIIVFVTPKVIVKEQQE